jgi:hypothetical protein
MCVVKNKGIVTLSYDKNQVAFFEDLGEEYNDYEMTGIKKTDDYYGSRGPIFYIHPRSVAYCQINDKFYITDLSDNGRILMTDGHLRHVYKTFNCSRDKFSGLESVSCNDTYVYVSVVGTGKVEVFSLDLNTNIDSFELGYKPERITVSNSTLCVSTSENVYFYDINTKALNQLNQPILTVHCTKCDVSSVDIPIIESQICNQKIEAQLDVLIEEVEKRKIDKFQELTSIYLILKKHNQVLIQLNFTIFKDLIEEKTDILNFENAIRCRFTTKYFQTRIYKANYIHVCIYSKCIFLYKII